MMYNFNLLGLFFVFFFGRLYMKIQCIPTLQNLSPRKNEKAIAFKGVTPMCWRRKDEGKHHEKYFESTRKNSHHAHTVGENSMKQKNAVSTVSQHFSVFHQILVKILDF